MPQLRSPAQVLHELWIREGYTSPAFLAAASVTFPSAAVTTEELILQVQALREAVLLEV